MAGPHPWSLAPGVTRRLCDKFMSSMKPSMKPSIKPRFALRLLRAFLLFAFLLLAFFVVFCLALSAQAAPAKNVVCAAPAARQKPPVVRIGQPYRAQIKTPNKFSNKSSRLRRKVVGLSLTFRCHADCNLPGEDANFQYLAWRTSVQFGKLGRK